MSSGKDRIPYNDTVEEVLCFGWIDSINKSLDPDHSIQRLSPRTSRSHYSQANIERLRWLLNENLIHPIAYIDSARKRPEEFAKRLAHFISKTGENKLLPGHKGDQAHPLTHTYHR